MYIDNYYESNNQASKYNYFFQKYRKKPCLCLKNIKSTVCLYESNNQASECNFFKSACCYSHGTSLHLYTIHEPNNQASESNFL